MSPDQVRPVRSPDCAEVISPPYPVRDRGHTSAGILQDRVMPDRVVLDTNAPLPWPWTIPLDLETPKRTVLPLARDSLGGTSMDAWAALPDHLHTSACSDNRLLFDSIASDSDCRVAPGLATLERTMAQVLSPMTQSTQSKQHSLAQRQHSTMSEHSLERLHPVMEMPDRCLLDAKSPFPWSWRLPLSCDSPPDQGKSRPDCRKSGLSQVSREAAAEQPVASRSRSPHSAQEASDEYSGVTPLLRHLNSAAGNTPRIMEIIQEAEEIYKSDKHMLANVYSTAMNLFGPVHCPQVDEFRDLSVKCMRVLCQIDPTQARELHKLLCACSHGKADARIYEARASMEEQLGDTREAMRLLQEGLSVGAQPPGMLRRLLQRLRPRALQMPEGAVAAEATQQARGTPCKVPQYSICTPEHNTASRPRWQRPETPAAPAVGTKACIGQEDAAAKPNSLVEELRSLFSDLREDLLREVQAAQRAALEQGLRLQAQLRRDLEGLRLEARHVHDPGSHERPHKCPRCCREAVEGAVDALMTGVEQAVGDALEIENLQLQGEGWQALADEVWESISVVNSLTRDNAPEGCGNTADQPEVPVQAIEDPRFPSQASGHGHLEGLAPLREMLGLGGPAPAWRPAPAPSADARPALAALATARSPRAMGQQEAWEETPACTPATSPALEAEDGKENARSSWALRDAAAKLELGRESPPCPVHARVQCFLR
mmetsp:Transcript_137027/g.333011  ORF Transcript_137027/g.333011 Transcript_137027/m.333011 type:complete len:715 (+) Transcript_137027:86-2230(+)